MRSIAITGLLLAAVAAAFASTVKLHVVAPASGHLVSAAVPVDASLHASSPSGSVDPIANFFTRRPSAPFVITPLIMPVVGVARTEIADSWGDPRDNGQRAHHGTDIIAPAGMPVVAAAAGVVEKLSVSAAGGTTIYIRSPDRRWSYYYAHLANYAPGLHEGQLVETGEMIGFVGDTGNAGLGNYHLHFGLSQMRTADGWWQGTPIDPYPSLAGKTGPG